MGITDQGSEVAVQATGGHIHVKDGKVEVLLFREAQVLPVSSQRLGGAGTRVCCWPPYWIVKSWKSARGDYTRSEDSEEECSGLKDSVINIIHLIPCWAFATSEIQIKCVDCWKCFC